jgi:predicted porin
MNKKIAILVVAGGVFVACASALAQERFQIYGRANLGADTYSATGATAGSGADFSRRARIYDAGSRLGFQGSEDIGAGLSAVYLMESGINIDAGGTTGQSGTTNPYTGFFSSRIGHVGLRGNWGQLTLGKSNVWWANGYMEQAGVNYTATGVPTFYGLLARGMNVGVSRVNNTVQYSALKGGYLFQASYSPRAAEAQGAASDAHGRLFGVTAQGQWGPFGVGLDWVTERGNNPAVGNTPAVTGQKARAAWQYMPGGMVSIIWVKSVQEHGGAAAIAAPTTPLGTLQALGLVADAAASKVEQTSFGVNWEQAFGAWQALAQWAKVNDITGCVTAGRCDNTNATAAMAAARYNFSKRTGAYLNYAAIKNDLNYTLDFVGGWMTSANISPAVPGAPGLPAGSAGADPKIFGVGVMHNF